MSLSASELEAATESAGSSDFDVEPEFKAIQGRSLGSIAWRRLRHDRVAMGAGVVVILLILIAILAHPLVILYGHHPNTENLNALSSETQLPLGSFGGAGGAHWLGVNPSLGADILSQLIYGARTSLVISSIATLLSLVLGVSLGVIAGFYRGWLDTVISRFMDLILSFPYLLFAIALLSIFNYVPSFAGLSGTPLRFATIIFVLGFFGFPYIGRIVRGQVKKYKIIYK